MRLKRILDDAADNSVIHKQVSNKCDDHDTTKSTQHITEALKDLFEAIEYTQEENIETQADARAATSKLLGKSRNIPPPMFDTDSDQRA
ncbi:hypothetical protein Trydic_g21118 [Trypoxylus dichotomus]